MRFQPCWVPNKASDGSEIEDNFKSDDWKHVPGEQLDNTVPWQRFQQVNVCCNAQGFPNEVVLKFKGNHDSGSDPGNAPAK